MFWLGVLTGIAILFLAELIIKFSIAYMQWKLNELKEKNNERK